MKKKEIIKSKFEYTELIKKCKYQKNNYFIVYYRKNDKYINRYGISIPKKYGKAHERNKIKRRLKNIIDKNQIKITKYYDYVIIVRKRTELLNYKEIEVNILSLFNRIGEKNEK